MPGAERKDLEMLRSLTGWDRPPAWCFDLPLRALAGGKAFLAETQAGCHLTGFSWLLGYKDYIWRLPGVECAGGRVGPWLGDRRPYLLSDLSLKWDPRGASCPEPQPPDL